jgi:hypothetical protein
MTLASQVCSHLSGRPDGSAYFVSRPWFESDMARLVSRSTRTPHALRRVPNGLIPLVDACKPTFGKRKHAQLNLDLNDRITDAQNKACFGPMSLNSPEFSNMTVKTIRQIPIETQHAWATVCAAAAKRILSDRGNEEYAMLFMSFPRLCLEFPSRENKVQGYQQPAKR